VITPRQARPRDCGDAGHKNGSRLATSINRGARRAARWRRNIPPWSRCIARELASRRPWSCPP
jgi:hypothetical protein